MNVKLTKRKAWELISRIQPRLNIKQEATPSDVAIFKASTGPEGLEIRCENDWFNHNGRIKLTIGNVDGGTPIIRYYYPDTLNRDYVAEQAEKEAEAKQARKEWVWAMGKEMAHIQLDTVLNETFADTASRDYLILRAAERGLSPYAATPAVLELSITPVSLTLPPDTRFSIGDLNYYVSAEKGNGKYEITCETAGEVGNDYGATVIPIEYVEGLETCTITALLIPGEDEEDNL